MGRSLPQPKREKEMAQPRRTTPVEIRFQPDIQIRYREEFDPLEGGHPISCTLKGNLTDIVSGLQYGIEEYKSGLVGRAAFTWRDGSEFNWGNHAIDAIRVLHAMRRNRTVKTWG